MKDYVNWGILAPGIIANSMATAMKSVGGKIHLHSVGSRDAGRAKDFAEKYGFEKYYGSYEEFLSDPELDAVYVSNPHAFHFDSVMASLEHGKHVLCEKPAGCNISQLNQMIEKSREKKLFFMEAMWTAFNPCIKKIRERISEGTIGELKHIQSYFCNRVPFNPKSRLWSPDMAGGALLDLGIYNIYFAMLVNGFAPIVKHGSIAKMYNNVDAWENVTLVFQNNVTTTFESALDIPSGSDTHDATIYGTKGYIKLQNFFMAQNATVHLYTGQWGNQNRIHEEIVSPFRVNGYEYELEEATECILNGKTESSFHTHETSVLLCDMMDTLRREWKFKYPFEKSIDMV